MCIYHRNCEGHITQYTTRPWGQHRTRMQGRCRRTMYWVREHHALCTTYYLLYVLLRRRAWDVETTSGPSSQLGGETLYRSFGKMGAPLYRQVGQQSLCWSAGLLVCTPRSSVEYQARARRRKPRVGALLSQGCRRQPTTDDVHLPACSVQLAGRMSRPGCQHLRQHAERSNARVEDGL